MALRVKQIGKFKKTVNYFNKLKAFNPHDLIKHYAELGVERLKAFTPRDTGKTAESWDYTLIEENEIYTVQWTNSNVKNGINIALLIDSGHVTLSGTYVPGFDYITPALSPILTDLRRELGKKVSVH